MLVPATARAASPGSLGVGPTRTTNGAKTSTCSGPKLEPGSRRRELGANPPTQRTPAFSHGAYQWLSQQTPRTHVWESTFRPSLPAPANSRMSLAWRNSAVLASNGSCVQARLQCTLAPKLMLMILARPATLALLSAS